MSDEPIEQLLVQIQRHLDARQGIRCSGDTASAHGDRFSGAVYDALEEAGVVMDAVRVEPALTPPHPHLVGGLWQKVRGQAHDLVVFYANRLAGVQRMFNREIMVALSALVTDLDRGGQADFGSEIAALREEVAALRKQMEQSAADSDRHPR